jgi:hypothetical protein
MKDKSLELSVEDLLRLTSYAHWIPMTQGLYRPYFEKNFPGWEWNQIIPVLINAKILVVYSKDLSHRALSHGLCIASEINGVRICIWDRRTEVEVMRSESIRPINHHLLFTNDSP